MDQQYKREGRVQGETPRAEVERLIHQICDRDPTAVDVILTGLREIESNPANLQVLQGL